MDLIIVRLLRGAVYALADCHLRFAAVYTAKVR